MGGILHQVTSKGGRRQYPEHGIGQEFLVTTIAPWEIRTSSTEVALALGVTRS